MFLRFFTELRDAKVPVSLKEYLALMEAMDRDVIGRRTEEFYYLSRAALVKDEKNLDKFDRVFGHVFKGIETVDDSLLAQIPGRMAAQAERTLPHRRGEGADPGAGRVREVDGRVEEAARGTKGRHQGGSKWIGTAGTSPFGAYGYSPEGVRIGQETGRNGRAVKVWDKREYKNLDDSVELGTRNIKIALRRLRKWAREGAPDELDLDETIDATARHGYLDIQMRPERRNTVKVLLLLDIGGSMDGHVKLCEELFSAAKTEFKHLEFFYFHNCLYEGVWKDNRRRHTEKLATWDVLHRFPRDWKVVFVGDASMSPYEIAMPGGSVEHWNEEAGAVWLKRVTDIYEKVVWLNPTAERYWEYAQSTQMIRELLGERMFPLTIDGLDRAMRQLGR